MQPEMEMRVRAGRGAVEGQSGRLRRELGRVESAWKHDASRVTEVDLAVAREVFAALEGPFPGDDFFSEEMDPGQAVLERKAEYTWVLDPIDGTNNFAAGLSGCSISLALLREGEPVYGFLYDLSRGRLMEGGPGIGAWDGGEPARVCGEEVGSMTTVGVHAPRDRSLAPMVGDVAARFKIRALGSSALHLGYVGVGLLDGSLDLNVKVWDIAAAHAVCLGGGGEVRYLNGKVFPLDAFDLHMAPIHYCAGTPAVCDVLEEIVSARIQSSR